MSAYEWAVYGPLRRVAFRDKPSETDIESVFSEQQREMDIADERRSPEERAEREAYKKAVRKVIDIWAQSTVDGVRIADRQLAMEGVFNVRDIVASLPKPWDLGKEKN